MPNFSVRPVVLIEQKCKCTYIPTNLRTYTRKEKIALYILDLSDKEVKLAVLYDEGSRIVEAI